MGELRIKIGNSLVDKGLLSIPDLDVQWVVDFPLFEKQETDTGI